MNTELKHIMAQKRAKEFAVRWVKSAWEDDLMTHDELMELMEKAAKYDAAKSKVERLFDEQ